MNSDSHTRWQSIGGFQIHYRPWGDQCIIYHCGSGDTHLLDSLAASILRWLQAEPLSKSEIVARVGVDLESSDLPNIESFVDSALQEFANLGIISSEVK